MLDDFVRLGRVNLTYQFQKAVIVFYSTHLCNTLVNKFCYFYEKLNLVNRNFVSDGIILGVAKIISKKIFHLEYSLDFLRKTE